MVPADIIIAKEMVPADILAKEMVPAYIIAMENGTCRYYS